MQSNVQEQDRLQAVLERSAQAQALRLVAARLSRESPESPGRVLHRMVESMANVAIALTMTTCAIYMFTVWMGW